MSLVRGRSRLTAWPVPLCALVALLAAGCARDPRPGTPEAAAEGERVVRQMSDALATARTLRFSTDELLEVVAPDGAKRALRLTRRVVVRRPDRLRFELHGKEGTALEVAAVYDGRSVSLLSSGQRVWAQAEVPATIDEMLDDVARRFALPVPVADVIYSSPYDAFLGGSARGGFVGRESIDGVECNALAYEDDLLEVRLWIPSSGRPLPRRVELLYKQVPSRPVARMSFADWELDAEVADSTFALAPPPGHARVEIAELVAGLLPSAAVGASPSPEATVKPASE